MVLFLLTSKRNCAKLMMLQFQSDTLALQKDIPSTLKSKHLLFKHKPKITQNVSKNKRNFFKLVNFFVHFVQFFLARLIESFNLVFLLFPHFLLTVELLQTIFWWQKCVLYSRIIDLVVTLLAGYFLSFFFSFWASVLYIVEEALAS